MVPNASTFGFLVNPSFPASYDQISDMQDAARAMNQPIQVLRANIDSELHAAFATIEEQRIPALVVAASPFFDTRRDALVELAKSHRVPTIYHFREFADAGGLMSYGVSFSDAYHQVGIYTGRVLKGGKRTSIAASAHDWSWHRPAVCRCPRSRRVLEGRRTISCRAIPTGGCVRRSHSEG
jgi:putative ABC transport system substrate-binding protein